MDPGSGSGQYDRLPLAAPLTTRPRLNRAQGLNNSSAPLVARLRQHNPEEVYFSSVVKAELIFTNNTREFGRVVGLQIEDWEQG